MFLITILSICRWWPVDSWEAVWLSKAAYGWWHGWWAHWGTWTSDRRLAWHRFLPWCKQNLAHERPIHSPISDYNAAHLEVPLCPVSNGPRDPASFSGHTAQDSSLKRLQEERQRLSGPSPHSTEGPHCCEGMWDLGDRGAHAYVRLFMLILLQNSIQL